MSFYGLEDFFSNAPDNKDTFLEQRVEVDFGKYKSAINCFIEHAATIKLQDLLEIADIMWSQKGFGYMPMRAKIAFVKKVVNRNVKLGDKYSSKRMVECFY